MPKPQRIRDPVHDLIEFDTGDFETMAWRALDSREFKRLRRIKQLGFSEFVFPGATHSRFAHSLGVFHTARQLSAVIRARLGGQYDQPRAEVAMAAALVHDLGHGPFSHAFEDATTKLGVKRRHEDWTAEIIRGDTEVGHRLEQYGGAAFRTSVAELLAGDTPSDIYAAIVSSQFDADRLDYVRRDRLMAGVQHGGFDFSWILANLEVDTIAFMTDGENFAEGESLVLGRKAFQAAEAYVLGLFHLYFTVYFHKATRSAEKMLTGILQRVGEHVAEGQGGITGLSERHPLISFLREPSLGNYLRLDDAVVWAALGTLSESEDMDLAELAVRLLNRELFKSFDVKARLDRAGEPAVAQFRYRLSEARKANKIGRFDLFEDTAARNPYKRRGFENDALSKVLIRREDGHGYQDLAERSSVVAALQPESLYRVYVRNDETRKLVEEIAGEAGR
ncbi:MAG TPA: HD domain-containing protein [Beijerinckiaceae bacterium]|jgi:hypothetical protein